MQWGLDCIQPQALPDYLFPMGISKNALAKPGRRAPYKALGKLPPRRGPQGVKSLRRRQRVMEGHAQQLACPE